MEIEVDVVTEKEKKPIKQIHADAFLGTASFLESAFLPILIDPFLVAMTIAKPQHWLRYALIAGITSIFGGLFGYLLGAIFFEFVGERLIAFYGAEDLFEKTVISMNNGAFFFTLIGAFTPVPYKLVAIVGGMLHINIFAFILASIIGRFGRFIMVTYISYRFGEYALRQFKKRLGIITIAIIVGILCYSAILFIQ
jgi:membrane protein YqaA with SNARE-associated domain